MFDSVDLPIRAFIEVRSQPTQISCAETFGRTTQTRHAQLQWISSDTNLPTAVPPLSRCDDLLGLKTSCILCCVGGDPQLRFLRYIHHSNDAAMALRALSSSNGTSLVMCGFEFTILTVAISFLLNISHWQTRQTSIWFCQKAKTPWLKHVSLIYLAINYEEYHFDQFYSKSLKPTAYIKTLRCGTSIYGVAGFVSKDKTDINADIDRLHLNSATDQLLDHALHYKCVNINTWILWFSTMVRFLFVGFSPKHV